MLIPYQFVDQEDARQVAADLAQWREPIWGIDDFPSPDGWRFAVVEMVCQIRNLPSMKRGVSRVTAPTSGVQQVRVYQIQVSNEEDEVIGFWGHPVGEVEA